jgi:hypothetical protein
MRLLSTVALVTLVVWSLAPRGQGTASLEQRSRVVGWAVYVNPHTPSIAVVLAASEKNDGVTMFAYASLRPRPQLLVGTRALLGDELADASGYRVIVPRRAVPAVDLVTGDRTECAVSFSVSRLTNPTETSGVICGFPFSRSETLAADVRRTVTVRDAAALFAR